MAGMMGQRSSGVPAERTSLFPIGSLRREMEDLVENFFGGMTLTGQPGSYLPSIDVSETSDAVHVSTDLPGMKAEEVQIDVRDNVVTISGSNSGRDRSADEERPKVSSDRTP
jgi:HSP20 family protein